MHGSLGFGICEGDFFLSHVGTSGLDVYIHYDTLPETIELHLKIG